MLSGQNLSEESIYRTVLASGSKQVCIECGEDSETERVVISLNKRLLVGYSRRGSFLFVWKAASLNQPGRVQSYLCRDCGRVSDDHIDGKCTWIDCGSNDIEPISSELAWEIERNTEDEPYFPKRGEYEPINGG